MTSPSLLTCPDPVSLNRPPRLRPPVTTKVVWTPGLPLRRRPVGPMKTVPLFTRPPGVSTIYGHWCLSLWTICYDCQCLPTPADDPWARSRTGVFSTVDLGADTGQGRTGEAEGDVSSGVDVVNGTVRVPLGMERVTRDTSDQSLLQCRSLESLCRRLQYQEFLPGRSHRTPTGPSRSSSGLADGNSSSTHTGLLPVLFPHDPPRFRPGRGSRGPYPDSWPWLNVGPGGSVTGRGP